MAAAPLLLPTPVKPVCPQSRWQPPVGSGAPRRGCCGEEAERGAERAAGGGEAKRSEATLCLPSGGGRRKAPRSAAACGELGACRAERPAVKWRVAAWPGPGPRRGACGLGRGLGRAALARRGMVLRSAGWKGVGTVGCTSGPPQGGSL